MCFSTRGWHRLCASWVYDKELTIDLSGLKSRQRWWNVSWSSGIGGSLRPSLATERDGRRRAGSSMAWSPESWEAGKQWGGWDQKGRSKMSDSSEHWFCKEKRSLEGLKIHAFLGICVEVSTKLWWICKEIHQQWGWGWGTRLEIFLAEIIELLEQGTKMSFQKRREESSQVVNKLEKNIMSHLWREKRSWSHC